MLHKMRFTTPPVTPIEILADNMKPYLFLPDPGPLYTLMAAVAGNMMEGAPVWLMFVGPPSCGKTELLNTLLGLPHTVEAASIASEGSLLSGTAARERSRNATGGILCEIGRHGALVLNDFTSILSKSTDRIAEIMAAFRETYSGRWTRHVGVEGGRTLSWAGKLAVFAGVTGKIDRHSQLSSELGERWVYYRFAEREAFQDCMLASEDRGTEWRVELREIVRSFFAKLNLSFGCNLPRREYTIPEKLRLHRLATVTARCRSSVARDLRTQEILGPRETEIETRLYTVFGQLLLGMDLIGVPESTRWKLLTKVAMDSMPLIRRVTIQAVFGHPITVEELTDIVGCDLTVMKRVVKDLKVQRVFDCVGNIVSLSTWMNENYKKLNHDGLTLVAKDG